MPTVRGWITQEKYILGWTPTEMEELLGLPRGYFSHGAVVWSLLRTPQVNEFELGGFTHWPGGQPVGGRRDQSISWTDDFVKKHKDFARNSWSLTGPDRLVKVSPNQEPTRVDTW